MLEKSIPSQPPILHYLWVNKDLQRLKKLNWELQTIYEHNGNSFVQFSGICMSDSVLKVTHPCSDSAPIGGEIARKRKRISFSQRNYDLKENS